MATAAPAQQTDKDLASIAEARALARRAKAAQLLLAEFSQAQVDSIVDAMAAAVTPHAEALARLAVEETGFGVVSDKVQKNLFGSKQVYEFIRPMKTVGVVKRIEDRKIVEIAEPFGVVAAIVPSTNPTSTAFMRLRTREAEADGLKPKYVYRWVSYSRISPNLKRAVLVAEDSAFWDHEGIDAEEIRRSIQDSLAKRQVPRGAARSRSSWQRIFTSHLRTIRCESSKS